MTGNVVVKRADAKWRREAVGKKSPPKKSGRDRTAIITVHRDGTSSLRLSGFDRASLAAIKSSARLTWDLDGRRWVIWSEHDREDVIDRLHLLGFSVAVRRSR